MNFFKHHIGDYDSATAHLSWDEDMAYSRLMRVYYRDEKPIPIDRKKVYRLVRSQSKAQREAVAPHGSTRTMILFAYARGVISRSTRTDGIPPQGSMSFCISQRAAA